MIELDSARQDMMWRCLDFIYPSYKKGKKKFEEPNGKVSRWNLEEFMKMQHKRWLGNYEPLRFMYLLEQFGVVELSWEKATPLRSYQQVTITLKGLKFLDDWKLSPDYAWEEVKK